MSKLELIILPERREELARKLSVDPEIAKEVSRMGLSMEPPGSDREIRFAEYLENMKISTDTLKGSADKAKMQRELKMLLEDKIWKERGLNLISLVKDRLERNRVEYTHLDALVIAFLIARIIILGKMW